MPGADAGSMPGELVRWEWTPMPSPNLYVNVHVNVYMHVYMNVDVHVPPLRHREIRVPPLHHRGRRRYDAASGQRTTKYGS